MEKINFTNDRLSKLSVPASARKEYADIKQPKLKLRITASGHMSFSVVKKGSDGKPKRHTIGTWPGTSIFDARAQTIKILSMLANGLDPTEEKKKKRVAGLTLKAVFEEYLQVRDLQEETVKDYIGKFERGFIDWFNKPIKSITSDMVQERHQKLTIVGKTTCNNCMRVLRFTMKYAHAKTYIESNPVDILTTLKLWHKIKPKERIIHSNELATWYESVLLLKNEKAKTYFLILLFMGFRSEETLHMEWGNINFKNSTLKLIDTKNGTTHSLTISDPILPYLSKLYDDKGESKWVFSNRYDTKPITRPNKQIKKVVEMSGVKFSPHDCRRTFATIAEGVGIPHTLTKRLMNHNNSISDVTNGYMITELKTLKDAMNKVSSYIMGLVEDSESLTKL